MKHKPITFETAILAKSKGLNDHFFHRLGEDSNRKVESEFCYDPEDETRELQTWSDNIGVSTNERLERLVSAPSQDMVKNWLRENHEIEVNILSYRAYDHIDDITEIKYTYTVNNWKVRWSVHDGTGLIMPEHYHGEGEDYYKVFEEGLKEALNLIK